MLFSLPQRGDIYFIRYNRPHPLIESRRLDRSGSTDRHNPRCPAYRLDKASQIGGSRKRIQNHFAQIRKSARQLANESQVAWAAYPIDARRTKKLHKVWEVPDIVSLSPQQSKAVYCESYLTMPYNSALIRLVCCRNILTRSLICKFLAPATRLSLERSISPPF
jgi:hypothetical protein